MPAASSPIRPLALADMPAAKAVIDEVGLFPSGLLDDMTAAHFGGASTGEIWLTYDEGRPIAIAYCAAERMTEGTWNMLLIAVRPSRQGRGIGAELVSFIERRLAEGGARILLVETSGLDAFARTRAFYDRMGYGAEARIRDFYQAGEDKVVFRKALRSAG